MTLHDELANNLQHNRVTRRQVLWLLGAYLEYLKLTVTRLYRLMCAFPG